MSKVPSLSYKKVIAALIRDGWIAEFWQDVSQVSLNEVWDNSEDNIYAELLEE